MNFLQILGTNFLKTHSHLSLTLFTLKNSVTSSMALSPSTSSEVESELKRLNVIKSTSDDQIPTKCIVIAADFIYHLISHIL